MLAAGSPSAVCLKGSAATQSVRFGSLHVPTTCARLRQTLGRTAAKSRQHSQVVSAIAAPEGLRGHVQAEGQTNAPNSFSQQEFDKFKQGYKSQYSELSFWVEDKDIEGTIPAELEGTLLRNGPGLLEVGGTKLAQPLDGDGMICKFAIKDGKIHFQNKYVRTHDFLKEQAAGKMLFRGVFSVGNPSGGLFFNPFDFTVKNVANTGVVNWGNKLLALYESDLPYQLDNDLKTIGTTTLNGAIDTDKQRFGAHYRIVTEADGSRRLIGFNFQEQSLAQSGVVTMWEFDDQFNSISKTQHTMPGGTFGFIHDVLVTDEHYVILENPIEMNFGRLLGKYALAKACLAECLEYKADKPTKIHVITRPGKRSSILGNQARATFETPAFFSFHHVNVFEAREDRLVVDTIALAGIDFSNNYDSAGMFEGEPGKGVVTRLIINAKTGQVDRHPILNDRASELPSVAPAVVGKPHKYAYVGSSRVNDKSNWGPLQVVMKLNLPTDLGLDTRFDVEAVSSDIWDAGSDQFAQEPIFCPRPGSSREDDGWLLVMVYDVQSDRTQLVILDAKDLQAGPVARVKLPHRIPYGIHGSFTQEYLGASEAAQNQSYDIRNGVGSGSEPKYA